VVIPVDIPIKRMTGRTTGRPEQGKHQSWREIWKGRVMILLNLSTQDTFKNCMYFSGLGHAAGGAVG
jgi:hypothetical protein